jgi:imidazolonepropionase-like amidohydrolase
VSDRTVLCEALVVTATGAPAFEGCVVVEEGRILDVLEGAAPAGLHGERTLRLGGRTLLPGLIDAHVHAAAVDADIAGQARRRHESEVALLAGPRLLVSGRPLSQTGGHGDQRGAGEQACAGGAGPHVGMVHVIADGPEQVRLAAREELRRGADQIKVMAGGGVVSPTDRLESVQYSPEELSAAVAAASAAGTYVLAHAYTPAAIEACVRAGVRSVEHGNLLDGPTARLMAERGTYLVPTLVTYERLREEGERHSISRESLEKLELVVEAGSRSLELALGAGVRIGSGSDLLGPMQRHQGEEIAIAARALGAMGAIVATTRTNAELLGLEGEIGTIEAGKRADLVVSDQNALDDPGILGRPGGVALVMLGGRVVLDRRS